MSPDAIWLDEQAELTLARLLPRLELARVGKKDDGIFLKRLKEHFADAFEMFYALCGGHYDFYYHLEQTLLTVAEMFDARSPVLRMLDAQLEANPMWFQSEKMVGAECWVDLFAGNLDDIRERTLYFEELGLTYLHLMLASRVPEGDNDGGNAVSSFRDANPALGTIKQLALLAQALRERGISLVLDVVMYDLTDQGDLVYSNPEVFRGILQEMLFLANQGAEILHLDVVQFISKQLDIVSDDLLQAHQVIRGLNAFACMASPALLLESKALVYPRHIRSYVDPKECALSYNPILTIAMWEALATRSTDFFRQTMNKQFALPPGCAWVNYLRSYDALGWEFADEDAAEMGLNPPDHRYFLNLFYLGRFPGSFAVGLPFNFDPLTQDMHISGTTASLAGLEKAIKLDDAAYLKTAIQRITMIQSVILSVGGIPLIYLGDEVGTLNDYSYHSDPAKTHDSRWAHRSSANSEKYVRRHDETTVEGQIFESLLHLIHLRKQTPALADGETYFLHTGNSHVLGYLRHNTLLVLANFSEFAQQTAVNTLQNEWPSVHNSVDLVTGQVLEGSSIQLAPYQFMWLTEAATAHKCVDEAHANSPE